MHIWHVSLETNPYRIESLPISTKPSVFESIASSKCRVGRLIDTFYQQSGRNKTLRFFLNHTSPEVLIRKLSFLYRRFYFYGNDIVHITLLKLKRTSQRTRKVMYLNPRCICNCIRSSGSQTGNAAHIRKFQAHFMLI